MQTQISDLAQESLLSEDRAMICVYRADARHEISWRQLSVGCLKSKYRQLMNGMADEKPQAYIQ
jgi:hypothetical protein